MTRFTPRRRTLGTLAGIAALALALTGCGSATPEATATSGSAVLGTVDTAFGAVEIPAPTDGDLRVVALGWSDGEVALSLGVKPVAIYDWQSFGEANKGVGEWATAEFGDETPVLIPRGDETLNYEQIQSLNPDVILNVRNSLDEKVYERLSDIAPTVSAPEGTPDWAIKWDAQVTQIAAALGKVDEGKASVAELTTKIADAKKAHPEFDGVEFVSASKFGDAYGANLAGDARFDLYAGLGFVQTPAVAALPAQGFYAPVSIEQVTALDSQVGILTTIGYPLQTIKDDSLISSLQMVKDGRGIFADPEGNIMAGTSAGTVAGLSLALDEALPLLTDAVGKLG